MFVCLFVCLRMCVCLCMCVCFSISSPVNTLLPPKVGEGIVFYPLRLWGGYTFSEYVTEGRGLEGSLRMGE